MDGMGWDGGCLQMFDVNLVTLVTLVTLVLTLAGTWR